ncbi:MAG: MBL fold metallo-hydrolase [Clostridia bacterium]|nr:MBL fold metallo-hydrolase [Clostridia bacterium]
MGYRAEKEKVEKKIRVIRWTVLCVLMALLIGLCTFSIFCPPSTWKYYVKKPDLEKRAEGELRMHFLDVGQGDSILIELPDGKVALIDGGNTTERTSTYILRYMNALKIDVIDYLVVTHADSDHCGGLAKVVEHKKVLNAYLPATKPEKADAVYAELYELILEECEPQYASRSISLSSAEGDYPYTFAFVYPYTDYLKEDFIDTFAETDNATSSVMWLDYMGASALFTGDAPCEVERMLSRDDSLGLLTNHGVDLDSTEILKVSHHGSADSTSLEFLQYLQVKTAVVSCGKDNRYGHPSETVRSMLQSVGATLYRTDEHGTVCITVKNTGEYTVETFK